MQAIVDEQTWWVIAGAFGAAVVGSAVVVWAVKRRGPPREEELTPGGHAPEPIIPGGSLPPPGEKASSYPGSRGKSDPASTWAQLRSQPGIVVRDPARAWGTQAMINTLVTAGTRFALEAPLIGLPASQMRVADISKQGGGSLPPHKSHHEGRDADITVTGVEGSKLPAVALPLLLHVFLEDPNVAGIFLDWNRQAEVFNALDVNPELDPDGLVRRELQYPLAPHSGRTRVRHWPGHAGHIHVRTVR